VKIAGQGFTHGVTAVLFGDVRATSCTVNSYRQITAVAPAGAARRRGRPSTRRSCGVAVDKCLRDQFI